MLLRGHCGWAAPVATDLILTELEAQATFFVYKTKAVNALQDNKIVTLEAWNTQRESPDYIIASQKLSKVKTQLVP